MLSPMLMLEQVTNTTRSVPKELRGTREGQYKILGAYTSKLNEYTKGWICDRSIFDVCAYSLLAGVWTTAEVHSILSQYSTKAYYPHYIFYLPIEFPLVQDGERPTKGREEVDEIILRLLKTYYPYFKTVRGSITDRVDSIVEFLLAEET